MILLTPELRLALRENDVFRRAYDKTGQRFDPSPVVKLFSPLGAATWLATELAEDDNTLFGLADLGCGCPELGTFSLSEIAAVRMPLGLGVERDLTFETTFPLSVWTECARRAGSILSAQTLLRRAARSGSTPGTAPELPHDPGEPDGG
ncbi:DUF2958 domain-containing protein [Sphingomonas populi]|uniref:DUF2958 domain-containing protein n=1 Tax=Sphingomonas populi TaxID=2484750 RepID=A0A4Q6XTA9_9SPHN|nr:DUF2958 domain-containing protein [Sphingomonas populi]RZF60792.1 DUF2958 domain-containing protein [Sphingomonas populi]